MLILPSHVLPVAPNRRLRVDTDIILKTLSHTMVSKRLYKYLQKLADVTTTPQSAHTLHPAAQVAGATSDLWPPTNIFVTFEYKKTLWLPILTSYKHNISNYA